MDIDTRVISAALSRLSYQTDFDLPEHDVRVERGFISAFSQKDRDCVAWVLNSNSFSHWLHIDTSSLLLVNFMRPSIRRRSIGGFICANLCHSLWQLTDDTDPIVLSFFCGEHLDLFDDPDASPKGILNSLLSQLLKQYDHFDPDILERFKYLDVEEDTTGLINYFVELLGCIPSTTTVFCIIDGLYLYDDERKKDALDLVRSLKMLSRRRSKSRYCSFKLFITGSGPWMIKTAKDCSTRDHILTVPDRVPRSPVTWLCRNRDGFDYVRNS